MNDTSLFDKAVAFAAKAHSSVTRRGHKLPYMLHPMEAAVIVAGISEDNEMLASALLHDVVEDTPCTIEEIRDEFGPRVAQIVDVLTDKSFPENGSLPVSESWRLRKEDSLKRIGAADRDTMIVALGDKLANMRAIARDYNVCGDSLWSDFKAGSKKALGWYYLGLAEALSPLGDIPAWQEFDALTKKIFT